MDFAWNTAMCGNQSGSVKLKAVHIFLSLVHLSPTLNFGLEFVLNPYDSFAKYKTVVCMFM